MLNEVLTGFPPEEFNINHQDGLGNTGTLLLSFFCRDFVGYSAILDEVRFY